MRLGRMTVSVFAFIVICIGLMAALGNRVNDAWHYLVHGDDQITFEQRHFIHATIVSAASTKLVATNEVYFGERIYVASGNGVNIVPGEVFIKKNGKVIRYTLSGGQ